MNDGVPLEEQPQDVAKRFRLEPLIDWSKVPCHLSSQAVSANQPLFRNRRQMSLIGNNVYSSLRTKVRPAPVSGADADMQEGPDRANSG